MNFHRHGIHTEPQELASPNVAMEQALLDAIIGDILEPRHFFDQLHAHIFKTMASLVGKGKVVTLTVLMPFYEGAENVDVGLTVPQYLGTLAARATTTGHAPRLRPRDRRYGFVGRCVDPVQHFGAGDIPTIPRVDPTMIVACIDDIEACGWLHDDLCSAIAGCALRAARGHKEIALAIWQRVQALIVALNNHPDLLTAYGLQPKNRIPTQLRRAAGAIPLSIATSGFDISALREAALLVATPGGHT